MRVTLLFRAAALPLTIFIIPGKRLDEETGLYYYGARYLDPQTSRWLSTDPAMGEYIPQAPVNEEARRRNGNLPGMGGVFNYVNLHVYHYAGNNPVKLTDLDGKSSEKNTVKLLHDNAQNIIAAGKEFGVDPVVIAACIYGEQRLNVNWIDHLTDRAAFFLDTSVGIGQVKISTAKMLEDSGYIEKTSSYIYSAMLIEISREEAIADKLLNPETNVRYVAAYLKYWQDRWSEAYSDIDNDIGVLTTLYNQGEKNKPHSSPKPNLFGEYAERNYEHIKMILEEVIE
jgi:hypothetical protein